MFRDLLFLSSSRVPLLTVRSLPGVSSSLLSRTCFSHDPVARRHEIPHRNYGFSASGRRVSVSLSRKAQPYSLTWERPTSRARSPCLRQHLVRQPSRPNSHICLSYYILPGQNLPQALSRVQKRRFRRVSTPHNLPSVGWGGWGARHKQWSKRPRQPLSLISVLVVILARSAPPLASCGIF